MNVPEPPQIIFEQPDPCPDRASANVTFHHALDPAKAPAHAWLVTLRISEAKGAEDKGAGGKGPLNAIGEITDASGAPVARRTIEGHECAGLARAVGVWAALVLDAEVERAKHAPPIPPPIAPSQEMSVTPIVPPPEPPEKPSPEAALFLAHSANERQIEVGLASYLMAGTGTGMLAGGTLFAVSEAGGGWFLRPALAFGRTFTEVSPTTQAYATMGAARFDACKRIPGNYLDKRGIQLDLCGGADVGFLFLDAQAPSTTSTVGTTKGEPSDTLALFALGPSLDLRGELGNELSVLVRGVVEWNVARTSADDATVNPALLIGRAEVGLSWRVR